MNKTHKKPKILRDLAKVPHDKLLHFFYGMIISTFLVLFLHYFIALGSVITIALAKEVYDRLSKSGTFDLYDALYTSIPILLIGLILYAKSF